MRWSGATSAQRSESPQYRVYEVERLGAALASPSDEAIEVPERIPYIVIVIDEFKI